ncbi:PREDICTED: uncharacterized protein LOC108566448 [Nicrophorus vespilloides]|uniref:Uncharacterized protein LOC108566448 n=1 Tax=Nicrophorus vespilloides TaxID=110193 RepID=A0ABM1N4R3_NICVS|nr:PREDICTED: uncharacterized protein LOC108566448 [Nicrophorus vespilloides]
MERTTIALCFLLTVAAFATGTEDEFSIKKILLEISSSDLDVEEGEFGQVPGSHDVVKSVAFDSSDSSEEQHVNNNDFGDNIPWSITWYVASFSGLIVFFVLISCSEWCCRKRSRSPTRAQNIRTAAASLSSSQMTTQTNSFQETTPPPAYDLFAPPSYDSLAAAAAANSGNSSLEKSEYDVYVVPVHAISNVFEAEGAVATNVDIDDPPSYNTLSTPIDTNLEENLNANIARHLNVS